jgi:hypothetical protein
MSLPLTHQQLHIIYQRLEGLITITLDLPEISSLYGSGYKKYFVIDEGGNARTNNITINRVDSDTINDNTSYVISTNYTSISLYNNGLSFKCKELL